MGLCGWLRSEVVPQYLEGFPGHNLLAICRVNVGWEEKSMPLVADTQIIWVFFALTLIPNSVALSFTSLYNSSFPILRDLSANLLLQMQRKRNESWSKLDYYYSIFLPSVV